MSEVFTAELSQHLTAKQGALNNSRVVVNGVLTLRKNNV
ncbi:MAG: hypothetical protein ACJAU1_000850 [Psychromonas sp.]|jgi:hypothetical protein